MKQSKNFLVLIFLSVAFISSAQFPPKVQVQIDSLNQVIANNTHDTLVAPAIMGLSEILYVTSLDTLGVLCERAIKLIESNLDKPGLPTLEKTSFEKTLAWALNNIGYYYGEKGNVPKQVEYYNQSVELHQKTGNKKGLADTYHNIGIVHTHKGDIPLAMDFYHKALKIREELDDKSGIAFSFNNIGAIYNNQKEYDLALEYYEKSLGIREEIGNKKGIADSYHNLSVTYRNKKNFTRALEYGNKSLEIHEVIGNKKGLAHAYRNMGSLYYQKGDINLAIPYFQKSLQLHETIGHPRGIIIALNKLGITNYMAGNLNQAVQQGTRALTLAKKVGLVKETENISKWLFAGYQKQGKNAEALATHQLYVQMRDSLINEKNTREVITQEMNYKYEKEKQVEKLALAEQQFQEKLQRHKRDQLTYGGFGALLLFGLIGYFGMRFRQRQKELERQKKITERLQNIDKIKDQFLANTSHELRTPLNGIIGLSESLYAGVAGKPTEEMKKNLSMIISSGKRLSGLINDILDFSKLREKDLKLNLRPVDIHSSVDVALHILAPSTQGKSIKLINLIPETLTAVHADEGRLQQILLNLIGNAIKFTEEGSVTITANQIDNKVSLSVADTGIGIPADKFESIFHAFDQVDASTERQYGGSGLGLNISQQLTLLHGGTITVESQVGQGSVFTLTLPASTEEATLSPRPSGVPINRPKVVENTMPLGFAPISDIVDIAPVVAPIEKNGTGSYNILVVDDEPVNRQVLSNYLKGDTFKVSQVTNGREAIAIAEKEKFDLVLLDVMMPGMNGYEVCEKIREKRLSSELPIIMITAKDQVTDLIKGLSHGANDYLIKPVSRGEMLARVKTHLNLLKINNSYSRFVPREFIRTLGKDNILDVKLGDQIEKNVTVMFTDIRAYTLLSESMTVEENFQFLNAYLGRIGPIIQQNNGYVNQYLGDGIMALFQQQPEDALLASIDMQKQLELYNKTRIAKKRVPIKVGIGLHYGALMLGIIGDETRMDTGVVSDTVNTASRVEGLTKFYGASIILSEDTVNQIDDVNLYAHRYLGKVRLKGRNEPLAIYEFFDGDTIEDVQLKSATKDDFESGLNAYYQKLFTEAAGHFKNVISVNDGDLSAQMYLRHCADYMVKGVDQEWTGVQEMAWK